MYRRLVGKPRWLVLISGCECDPYFGLHDAPRPMGAQIRLANRLSARGTYALLAAAGRILIPFPVLCASFTTVFTDVATLQKGS